MLDNEVLKTLNERYSCPDFTHELPEREKLDAIARAAIASPSGTNSQPWRVIMVTNRELIREVEDETLRMMGQIPTFKGFYDMVMSTGKKLFYNAPCMMFIPINKQDPYAQYDCGIVSQSVAVAAHSLGVASRIVAICDAAFQGDKSAELKEKLCFPENFDFGLAVLLGNAARTKEPHQPDPGKIICID